MITTARSALDVGIKAARAGHRTGDIGAVIQKFVEEEGLNVVRDLAGHGVGYSPHEEPYIPNYGRRGTGAELVPGMVIALEPMVTSGSGQVKLLSDEFTYVTREGEFASHFEHTIAITENEPIILTE